VFRVLVRIDYSVLNEFERIKKPFEEVIQLGRMLVGFLGIVKCSANATSLQNNADLGWPLIQTIVRKQIACSMYDFKEHVKALTANP
jgi:hypothetical protein